MQKTSEHEYRELMEIRSYKIFKSNELIQKSRFHLSVQEQKIILYIISQIKPEDMELREHVFKIGDFCRICGLDARNGANYKYIKKKLKDLRDKSVWVTLENEYEVTLAWLDYVAMHENSGTIIIKIPDMMKPHLLQLRERYTQYELLYTLAMKSQYSIRMYELLKSYEYQREKIFDIEELKKRLSAENYQRFPDFKRKVLDISMREINDLSDLLVTYNIIQEGKRYAKIKFSIEIKTDLEERLKTWANIDEVISPNQISLLKKISMAESSEKQAI